MNMTFIKEEETELESLISRDLQILKLHCIMMKLYIYLLIYLTELLHSDEALYLFAYLLNRTFA